MNVSITIVIPCYNSAQWVSKAIESVLIQSGPEVEILAINDGSTDETLEVLLAFGDRIRVITKPNEGVVSARRAGVSAAQGKFIKFLDSDDEIPPGSIKSMLEATAMFQDCAFVGRSVDILGAGSVVDKSMYNVACKPENFSAFPSEFLLTQATHSGLWLIPRELFYSSSLLVDSNVHLGEEYSFCIRMIRSGITIRFIDAVVYAARIHGSPGRLSRTTDEGRHLKQADLIGEAIDFIRHDIPGHDVSALSKISGLCWTRGRDCLRMGNGLAAKRYFDLATRADNNVGPTGSLPYRITCAIFGPVWAEKLFELVKNLSYSRRTAH